METFGIAVKTTHKPSCKLNMVTIMRRALYGHIRYRSFISQPLFYFHPVSVIVCHNPQGNSDWCTVLQL